MSNHDPLRSPQRRCESYHSSPAIPLATFLHQSLTIRVILHLAARRTRLAKQRRSKGETLLPQPSASEAGPMTKLAMFASLALAGFLAGVLMVVLPRFHLLPDDSDVLYAAAFGVVIAGYFVLFRRLRSAWKVLGFIATSFVAYIAAFISTIETPLHIKFLDFSQRGFALLSTDNFFTGGVVGAAILFAGFFLFLSPRQGWRPFLLKALAFSLLAGLLAVFAWVVGNSVGSDDWDYNSLHVIWQAGIACMFGFLLPREESVSVS